VIVAIESASPDQSVALAAPDGGTLATAAWTAERGQGSELLPRLLGLLAEQGAGLDRVTGVAVGLGPGSFTGLRVGLALAKGLATGLGVPIAGVPSLEAWLSAEPDAEAALVRSGAAEAWALGRADTEPRLVAFDAVPDAARDRILVAPRELATTLGLARAVPPDGAAAAVARMAASRLASGAADDLARLEPVYLRPPRGLADAPAVPVTWL
jgi:tRNA threonylcarbamoyladenosine biosynthesis protein TsaB